MVYTPHQITINIASFVNVVFKACMLRYVNQREKNLVSRVALLPGKFFLSKKFFKQMRKKYWLFLRIFKKKTCQQKSRIFLDSLEDFQTVSKIAIMTGKFQDSQEDFPKV